MYQLEFLGRRKEPRFKTADEHSLKCDCFHEDDEPKSGSVIDMSTHGLRFLCDDDFSIGQPVLIELKTEGSLGAFGGVIRRVDPWVGGQTVFGCELVEPLTDEVLKTLSQQGIVDRRNADRVPWKQPAKMSWELQSEEIDIEIQDCSFGGMKISSRVAIPENVRVRIRLETGDAPVVIDAKTVWQSQHDDQCLTGLAFFNRDLPIAVRKVLEQGELRSEDALPSMRRRTIRQSMLVVATMVVFVVTLLQSGQTPYTLSLQIDASNEQRGVQRGQENWLYQVVEQLESIDWSGYADRLNFDTKRSSL